MDVDRQAVLLVDRHAVLDMDVDLGRQAMLDGFS